jgi:hypothetical protein
MPDYRYKDAVALAFDANKKRLRTEGSIVLAALMNEALNEMTTRFNAGLSEGEILEIGGSRDELRALLRDVAQRELGPGKDVA